MIDLVIFVIVSNCGAFYESDMDTWFLGLSEAIENYYSIDNYVLCAEGIQSINISKDYAEYYIYVFMDYDHDPILKKYFGYSIYPDKAYIGWTSEYDQVNAWVITHELLHLALYEEGNDRIQIEYMLYHQLEPQSKDQSCIITYHEKYYWAMHKCYMVYDKNQVKSTGTE